MKMAAVVCSCDGTGPRFILLSRTALVCAYPDCRADTQKNLEFEARKSFRTGGTCWYIQCTELWMEFTHLCLHRWLLKQWGLWLLLFLSLSLSCCSLASLCSAASLSFWLALILCSLASLCSSVSTAISLTMSDAHPLQPGLSLFFSLGSPSFPSLLLDILFALKRY